MKEALAICGVLTLMLTSSACTEPAEPNLSYDALIALSGRALSLQIKTSELKTRTFVEGDSVALGCLSDPVEGVDKLTAQIHELGDLVSLAKKMRDRRDIVNVNSFIGVQISEVKSTADKYRQFRLASMPRYCEQFPTVVQVATSLQDFSTEASDRLRRITPIH
jgi:hypothetical protein